MKKLFCVPFTAIERVENSCIATVEAESKKEAFDMVKQVIEDEKSPFCEFASAWDGYNDVTIDISASEYTIDGIGEDAVKEASDSLLGIGTIHQMVLKEAVAAMNIICRSLEDGGEVDSYVLGKFDLSYAILKESENVLTHLDIWKEITDFSHIRVKFEKSILGEKSFLAQQDFLVLNRGKEK